MSDKPIIHGILLAAGFSARMGDSNKLLLPINQKAMIRHVVDNILASHISHLTVIVGYQSEKIEAVLKDCPVEILFNEMYAKGMIYSIRKGVTHLPMEIDAFMIFQGDMTDMRPRHINQLIDHFHKSEMDEVIVVPSNDGIQGNPVIFDVVYRDFFLKHRLPISGKVVLNRFKEKILSFESQERAYYHDIDTPEDYKRIT